MERRGLIPLYTRQNKFSQLPPLPPSSTTTLAAVALQDHWARTLAIGKTFGPRQVGLGPAARAKQRKEARPVVDTGRSKPKPKLSRPVEQEYVLDEKPPPLTLAQKLGLVEAPEQHLSEMEWKNVKAKSNARDDSMEPCVICKEDFGLQEQVLLSCSHVFHRVLWSGKEESDLEVRRMACLQAFERYTGRKTCPMCRREQYQTRVIHEGAKLHRLKCITKIQAAWRGYVVRCWYKKLRQTVPPKDPKLRRSFYIDKLEDITDRMVKSCDFDVNSFLSEIDSSLEQSRDIFRQFDAIHRIITDEDWEMIQLKAVERSHQDCPICLTSLIATSPEKSAPGPSPREGAGDSKSKGPAQPTKTASALKVDKSQTAKHRGRAASGRRTTAQSPGDQAKQSSEAGAEMPAKKVGRPRKTVLLSCTHVFHETCLLTLEELAMGEIRNSCPVCRAVYQKRVITL